MPDRDPAPALTAPFDQGVFLLHFNRGREAFQEGRYAEARKELEAAQKHRPDEADVLNLLGLVYFKTLAYPEAEVIYRRLTQDNPTVFTLHSNLGLILFKQGKMDEAEQYLLRAIELRPNYAKSRLYLGLLYRQRGKLVKALEHLRFAGADKLVREVELELRPPTPKPATVPTPASPPAPAPSLTSTQPMTPPVVPPQPAPQKPAFSTNKVKAVRVDPEDTQRQAQVRTQPAASLPPELQQTMRQEGPAATTNAGHTAARKLQDAVDETPLGDEKRIDLQRRIEGASKTFALHENGFLEINFAHNVHVKRGTVSSYSGNLKFTAETGLLGTTAQTLVKAVGQGKIFVYEKGRKTFLLDLNEEFIYVEGSNLLALEETLTYRVEPIYDAAYQKKIDTVKIFGKGSLAISTSIEPLTLRVTREYPLSISSKALVAWTGNLIPTVMDDQSLADVMIESGEDGGFKIRFEGEGVVVSES
jgi:Flp pilus assembly protein TadD/uncharacterized protein (AIM24 family)